MTRKSTVVVKSHRKSITHISRRDAWIKENETWGMMNRMITNSQRELVPDGRSDLRERSITKIYTASTYVGCVSFLEEWLNETGKRVQNHSNSDKSGWQYGKWFYHSHRASSGSADGNEYAVTLSNTKNETRRSVHHALQLREQSARMADSFVVPVPHPLGMATTY